MSGAGQSPRWVAYDTLRAVHSSDAYANLLLPRAIGRAGLSAADAGLATELTYGTLRREGTYDAVIAETIWGLLVNAALTKSRSIDTYFSWL